MEWYYAKDGRQNGPVDTDKLNKLLSTGEITMQTLIWREGMPNWQGYEVVFAAHPPPLLAGTVQRQLCSSCRRYCAEDELMKYGTLLVCGNCKPAFLQKLKESGRASTGHLWRNHKLLVMDRAAVLPDRCIKCNRPANGFRLKRKLFWHSPVVYFLILINIIIYAIAASLSGKRATIEVGLCDAHRQRRKLAITAGWGLFLLGFLTICVGASLKEPAIAVFAGILLIIAGAIAGASLSAVVSAKKIDATHIYLKGVDPDYLRDLPEWTGSN